MRIEKLALELCVSDRVKRGEVIMRICEALPRFVHGVLVAMPAARAERAAMTVVQNANGDTVTEQRNANGETITVRELADCPGRVEIRRWMHGC